MILNINNADCSGTLKRYLQSLKLQFERVRSEDYIANDIIIEINELLNTCDIISVNYLRKRLIMLNLALSTYINGFEDEMLVAFMYMCIYDQYENYVDINDPWGSEKFEVEDGDKI